MKCIQNFAYFSQFVKLFEQHVVSLALKTIPVIITPRTTQERPSRRTIEVVNQTLYTLTCWTINQAACRLDDDDDRHRTKRHIFAKRSQLKRDDRPLLSTLTGVNLIFSISKRPKLFRLHPVS